MTTLKASFQHQLQAIQQSITEQVKHYVELVTSGDYDELLDSLYDLTSCLSTDLSIEVANFKGSWEDILQEEDNAFTENERNMVLSQKSKFRRTLLRFLKRELPKKIRNFERLEHVKAFNEQLKTLPNIPIADVQVDEDILEVLVGETSELTSMTQLRGDVERLKKKLTLYQNCIQAAQGVVKVHVCNPISGQTGSGSGFLTPDNYLYTNYHVFVTPSFERKHSFGQAATPEQLSQIIVNSTIEFGFEEKSSMRNNGNTYQLDVNDFCYSHFRDLDYVRVKVKNNPVGQWQALSINADALLKKGDCVPIIQHPEGKIKQVALKSNHIKAFTDNNRKVFYATDTLKGSSGSPVFNLNWEVVALHHAGRKMENGAGGYLIDGERQDSNKGILFKYILADVHQKISSNGSLEVLSTEKLNQPRITTPSPTTKVYQKPIKIFLLYDVADMPACKKLKKHLFMMQMTGKIKLFDMHQDLSAGRVTKEEWENKLIHSDVALLFVSANLFNDPPDAFELFYEQQQKEKLHNLVPILISAFDWKQLDSIAPLRVLPTNGEPVSWWLSNGLGEDAAYTDISKGIQQLVEDLLNGGRG